MKQQLDFYMTEFVMQYNDGVSTTDEVVELAKVITWVSEDVI